MRLGYALSLGIFNNDGWHYSDAHDRIAAWFNERVDWSHRWSEASHEHPGQNRAPVLEPKRKPRKRAPAVKRKRPGRRLFDGSLVLQRAVAHLDPSWPDDVMRADAQAGRDATFAIAEAKFKIKTLTRCLDSDIYDHELVRAEIRRLEAIVA